MKLDLGRLRRNDNAESKADGATEKKNKEGFLHDLVTDLRNRRLIPVIAALVLATLAVPILIGGSDSELSGDGEGIVDGSAVDPSDGSELSPAVLSQSPQLRDAARLDSFKRKNPFKQQLTGPPKRVQREIERALRQEELAQSSGGGGGSESSGSGASGSEGGSGRGPTEAPVGSGTEGETGGDPTGGSGDDGSTGGSGDGGSGGGSPGSGGGNDPSNGGNGGDGNDDGGDGGGGTVADAYKVDVRVGVVGNTRQRRGVEEREFIVHGDARLFQFVRQSGRGTEAVFLVSQNAVEVGGEGECTPRGDRCELTLTEGEEHQFRYRRNGKVYRLKLINLRPVTD